MDAIFVGRERRYNRRFEQMCGHYLVEPVACTPASGWEKGQVENQVGLVRERFFTPRLRFRSYDELNTWLLDRCTAHARRAAHPELKDHTVQQVFEAADRPALIAYRGPFDGFHALPAAVSKTLLVRFEYNKYSVHAKAAGRPVEVYAYAERIVIRQEGEVVGEHAGGTVMRAIRAVVEPIGRDDIGLEDVRSEQPAHVTRGTTFEIVAGGTKAADRPPRHSCKRFEDGCLLWSMPIGTRECAGRPLL